MTRRDVLIPAAAGALLRGRRAFAKASQPSTRVNFEIPQHACDCHTHIFGDPARFPFWPDRSYTPETALPAEMTALHRALHIERVVIGTRSMYGTDNSATLYGMKARGRNARGIAVIDEKTPESALDAMAKAGVRGIRLKLVNASQNDPEVVRQRFRAAAEPNEDPRLAYPDIHEPCRDFRHKGSGRRVAGAGGVRPFRGPRCNSGSTAAGFPGRS